MCVHCVCVYARALVCARGKWKHTVTRLFLHRETAGNEIRDRGLTSRRKRRGGGDPREGREECGEKFE